MCSKTKSHWYIVPFHYPPPHHKNMSNEKSSIYRSISQTHQFLSFQSVRISQIIGLVTCRPFIEKYSDSTVRCFSQTICTTAPQNRSGLTKSRWYIVPFHCQSPHHKKDVSNEKSLIYSSIFANAPIRRFPECSSTTDNRSGRVSTRAELMAIRCWSAPVRVDHRLARWSKQLLPGGPCLQHITSTSSNRRLEILAYNTLLLLVVIVAWRSLPTTRY